jgi:hypothetical protein
MLIQLEFRAEGANINSLLYKSLVNFVIRCSLCDLKKVVTKKTTCNLLTCCW